MRKDKDVIGLNPVGREQLKELEATNWFAEEGDVARLCVAYAIQAGVELADATGAVTKWSIGGFDGSGELRLLVRALYPECDGPVRQIEHLMHEGLRLVTERIKAGGVTAADLLTGPSPLA